MFVRANKDFLKNYSPFTIHHSSQPKVADITLIVLLILAGVTISYISGGGIIDKTQVAMDMYENADKKQQDIINEIDDYMKEEIANNNSGEDTLENENNTGGSGSGSDSTGIQVGDIVSAEDIAKVEDKSEIYGAEVKGYDCENNAGIESWKLFYSDDENVYLIASNYIHKDYCPNGIEGTPITDNRNGYQLYFNNIIDDYNGISDITDERIKKLNEDYFTKFGSKNSTYNNMKAVAYMLDTSEGVWGKFAGEKAEYAIGGPTLELLFKSYNEKYNTNNKYQAQAEDEHGYQISADGGESFGDDIENRSDYLNESDDLYVINEIDDNNVFAMWVASPSPFDESNDVYGVYCDGRVFNTWCYDYGYSFRPVVCLQPNVELEKQQDGSFLLK